MKSLRTANLRTISLSEIIDLAVHPVADLFPMLPNEVRKEDGKLETLTLPELGDSILEYGLQKPIVLWAVPDTNERQVLDGRNRRAACLLVIEALGESPESYMLPVEDFIGTQEEADEYVLTLNIDRRDLTPGQRAFTAVGYSTCKHGGDRRSTQTGNVVTDDSLAQRFRVSTRYIREARTTLKQIDAERQQAQDASHEAERQQAIAQQKRAEIQAARHSDDAAMAAIASEAANRASAAAVEASEKATDKAKMAAVKQGRVEKVKSGTASMGSLVKETRTETSATDPVVRFRSKLNSASSNFKQAISELAGASTQGEDDYNFIGRKITDLIAHFEVEFGVKQDEE